MSATICPACNSPCQEGHRFCPDCGFEVGQAGREGDPFLGMSIGGKFVLREQVGSGGMGNVYMAVQEQVGRTVAVKIMHRHLLGDERAAARFINEARAASQLNHPHSIAVLDFGQTDAGILYIVMEFLRGRSLETVLDEEFPVPFGRVVSILCQVMDAVDAAHKLGIIHRDLKPENIFLEGTVGEDFVKVLDFGVAKMLDREDVKTITSPGLVPGTPEYMSPEQARGWPLDPRSDVYSMGVILYEMLTNTVPFKGKSALETMMAHVQDPPVAPSKRRPDRHIPAALDTIVLWALAKQPADRIASAAQFRDVISAWAVASGIWPSERAAQEEPLAQRSKKMLEEFFDTDELSALDDKVVEEEQARTAPRTDKRLRPDAATVMRTGKLQGRDLEVEQLMAFINGQHSSVLRIEAPTGFGKSRLAQLAKQEAELAQREVIHARPNAGWATVSLSPVQQVAAHCLGLEPQGPRTVDAVRWAAERLELSAEDLPGLLELFKLEGVEQLAPEDRRRERAVSLRNLVAGAGEQRPMLLVFEGVQLYDVSSQELVAWLAAADWAPAVKVLITHDPQYLQLWSGGVELMTLLPLPEPDRLELLRAVFEKDDPYLMPRISQRSKGNPLFILQMAFADVFEDISVPPDKVVDLVAARLERVPLRERETLQLMAVLNDRVTPEILSQIVGGPVDPEALDRLVEKGYIWFNEGGYTFVHRLVALAIHSTIPAEVRRRQHQAVAGYLRSSGAPVAAVAHHAYEAEDGPQTLDELVAAGAWAVGCMDHTAAVQWYSRAMDTVRKEWGKGRIEAATLDQLAVDLAHRLASSLRESGDTSTARGILEETLSVAAGEAASRAALRLELGSIDLELGHLQRAARQLTLARGDAEISGAGALRSRVRRALARVVGLLGQKGEAGRLVMESVADDTERGEVSWSTLLESAEICSQIGLPDRARGFLLDALQQAESEKAVLGKLRILRLMADVHRTSQEWQMAEMRLQQARDLMQRHALGDRGARAGLLLELGSLRRILGDQDQARELLSEARELAGSIGHWEGIRQADAELEVLALPPMIDDGVEAPE